MQTIGGEEVQGLYDVPADHPHDGGDPGEKDIGRTGWYGFWSLDHEKSG